MKSPRSRRALWISTSLSNRGGICTYVRNARETPLWRDWNVRHIATHKDGGVGSMVRAYLIGVALFVKELLLRRPDIVHIHTASNGSFVRKSVLTWWSSWAGIPVVLHIHGAEFDAFFVSAPRIFQAFIRATLRRADIVVALGYAWERELRAIAPSANIIVVPNAVRLEAAVPQEVVPQVNVIFLGKVCDRKGTFALLDAWAKLMNDIGCPSPARLTIAGDGDVSRARERIADLSIGDTCEVLGWVPSSTVDSLLASGHVLVLPSMAEGQPMSILEAMARGLAVVASNVGGIPEMLSGGAGLLVDPGDLGDLAYKLSCVIGSPEQRAALGANAHMKVKTEFGIERVSAYFDELYRGLLSK